MTGSGIEEHAVDPRDEARHDPEPDRLFNESWYFDFAARDGSIGGWIRAGLYPNMETTWYQAFIVRPGDATVGVVDFEAPLPEGDAGPVRASGFNAGLECVGPLQRWILTGSGKGRALDTPSDGYKLPGAGSETDLEFDLTWDTDGHPFHYMITPRYEVPCSVSGTVTLDGQVTTVEGIGQRDHSWAVRDWWSLAWLWTAATLEDGTRIHASNIQLPGTSVTFGYVQDGRGNLDVVTQSTVAASIDDKMLPVSTRVGLLRDGTSAALEVDLEPLAHGPVSFTDVDGRTTHFARSLCRFTTPDGRVGHGWAEWNMPAGVDLAW